MGVQSIIKPRRPGSRWIETDYPLRGNEDDYPYRPVIKKDRDCFKCEYGKMIYMTYDPPYGCNYMDKYKSLLCEAGKVPICRHGFIKKKEFSV